LNDLPDVPRCVKGLYADDTTLKSSGGSHDLKSIVNNLEAGLKIIDKYLTNRKIKLNKNKTEAIIFTHSRIFNRSKNSDQIRFGNTELIWKGYVQYLGILLDKKLLFKQHIEHNVSKTKKAISILYPLLKKGSAVYSKKILFKSYLLPIMTYACPAWSNAAPTHISKLQILQNKILRMILNAPYITPIVQLHNDSKIPYIKDFIAKLCDKFYKF
jgi:hypothetical protein